jgi:hypothetical protein
MVWRFSAMPQKLRPDPGEKEALFACVKRLTGDLPLVAAAGGAASAVAIEEISRIQRWGWNADGKSTFGGETRPRGDRQFLP